MSKHALAPLFRHLFQLTPPIPISFQWRFHLSSSGSTCAVEAAPRVVPVQACAPLPFQPAPQHSHLFLWPTGLYASELPGEAERLALPTKRARLAQPLSLQFEHAFHSKIHMAQPSQEIESLLNKASTIARRANPALESQGFSRLLCLGRHI